MHVEYIAWGVISSIVPVARILAAQLLHRLDQVKRESGYNVHGSQDRTIFIGKTTNCLLDKGIYLE